MKHCLFLDSYKNLVHVYETAPEFLDNTIVKVEINNKPATLQSVVDNLDLPIMQQLALEELVKHNGYNKEYDEEEVEECLEYLNGSCTTDLAYIFKNTKNVPMFLSILKDAYNDISDTHDISNKLINWSIYLGTTLYEFLEEVSISGLDYSYNGDTVTLVNQDELDNYADKDYYMEEACDQIPSHFLSGFDAEKWWEEVKDGYVPYIIENFSYTGDETNMIES